MLQKYLLPSLRGGGHWLPWAAQADDQTIYGPITVTATRIPTPASQVPAGVTVLTQADFAKRGDNTLVQALTRCRG